MKKPLYIVLTAAMVMGLALAGCEGPAGPEGPQGLQGEQGPVGPQGPEGNANIMYSDWMDIEWHEQSDDVLKQMIIDEPRVTPGFLDNGGVVFMFWKNEVELTEGGSVEVIRQLPYVTGSFFVGFWYLGEEGESGRINFHIISNDGTATPPPIPDNLWEGRQIRYLLVPGSVNLATKRVNWKDYEAAAEYFGIPD